MRLMKLKVTLQTIWEELPQEHVNKAVAKFTKRLTANMAETVNGGHFEHLQPLCPFPYSSHQQTGSFQTLRKGKKLDGWSLYKSPMCR